MYDVSPKLLRTNIGTFVTLGIISVATNMSTFRGREKTTVWFVLKRYHETGKLTRRRQGSCAKRKTTLHEDRFDFAQCCGALPVITTKVFRLLIEIDREGGRTGRTGRREDGKDGKEGGREGREGGRTGRKGRMKDGKDGKEGGNHSV